MSKGLSLEELRNTLEGDAQQKVKELELQVTGLLNTINAKEGLIRHLKGEAERQDKQAYYLFNRCRALSGQVMCQFCGIRVSCRDTINKYGKVKIPTHEETEKFLLDRCDSIIKGYEVAHPEEDKK